MIGGVLGFRTIKKTYQASVLLLGLLTVLTIQACTFSSTEDLLLGPNQVAPTTSQVNGGGNNSITTTTTLVTYFVATDHGAASDSNSGLVSTAPLKTIQAAIAKVQPGQLISIAEGIYREFVDIQKSGTFSAPIYIEGTGDVQIRGSNVVTGWVLHSGNIWKKTGWTYNSQMVFSDEVLLKQIGGWMPDVNMRTYWQSGGGRVGNSVADMVAGSFYLEHLTDPATLGGGSANGTLYVWLPDGSNPNNHFIEAIARPFLLFAIGDYIRIKGIKMKHGGSSSVNNWPAVNFYGKGNHVTNVSVTYSDANGVGFTNLSPGSIADEGIISGCDFSHNGQTGLGTTGQYITVKDSSTNYNNFRLFEPGWHSGGIKSIPGNKDVKIIRHKAINNKGPGIWFDTVSGEIDDSLEDSRILIEDSIVIGNKDVGIFPEISRGFIIRGNLVSGNIGYGIFVSNSSDVKIYNNTIINNTVWGVWINTEPTRSFTGLNPGIPARDNLVACNLFSGTHAIAITGLTTNNPPAGKYNNNTSNYNTFANSSDTYFNRNQTTYTGAIEWYVHTANDMDSLLNISYQDTDYCKNLY